ncbi:MAG: DUF3179 domain-containing protein [Marivibrio sp.]|uniref:DUF3179 domain-containing protein n=1 Tax=Marivibrio sp. TaxID=2039719 RepID=UPI0032EB7D51
MIATPAILYGVMMMRPLLAAVLLVALSTGPAAASPEAWKHAWPHTDFTRHSVPFTEIRSGGPPKDGIPPIDQPRFEAAGEIDDLAATEPVIGVAIDGDWRAYPLRVLMWHEIVNDRVGGAPIAVTFCPLCNAAIVFDRRLPDGTVLDFGTTGKLRHSDLVMYDRQTESWWQQFLGEAIVGEMTGAELEILPSRLESLAAFRARAPADAKILVPNDADFRRYGHNPYKGYDSLARPFLYHGETPPGLEPLARVVSLQDKSRAWSLDLLRARGRIETPEGVILTWTPGQNSALDTAEIAKGRDVGNVVATEDGRDVPYFVDFAFAFHAFHPDAPIVTD